LSPARKSFNDLNEKILSGSSPGYKVASGVYNPSGVSGCVGLIVQNCLPLLLLVLSLSLTLSPPSQAAEGQTVPKEKDPSKTDTKNSKSKADKTDNAPKSDAKTSTEIQDKISAISKRIAEQSEILKKMVTLIPQGRYAEAIPYAKQLLELSVNDWGSDHDFVATAQHNLGFLYQQTGDYAQAEPLFLQALAIREKALGPDHPDVARSLNGLALLYQEEGDYKQAEALFKRALQIKEKKFGNAGPEYALELNNLAVLYKDQGEYDKAEELLKNILTVFEKAYGEKDVRVATVMNNLAGIYRAKGDFNQARTLYERTIEIDKELIANDHPDYARDLNNLALLYFEEGKYDLSAPLLKQALEINEKSLGATHPDLVAILNNLAMLSIVQNNIEQAIAYQKRANEISEQTMLMILSSGTEEQKRLFLARRKDELSATLSLNTKFAPENKEATKLAVGTILRRKGRVLDAVSHQLLSLRQHLSEADQKLLDEISATRADLSARVLHGPGQDKKEDYLKSITDLQRKADQLEKEISSHSAAFKTQQIPVTVEAVQQAIPQDMSLVEFANYRLLDSKAKTQKERYGSARYVAYILNHEGDPQVVDLGEASAIDKGITELRDSLKNSGSSDYKQKARALDKLIMEPVRKRLGATKKTLLISPDGAMNILPFASLIDEHGKFLIENYSLDYLTSGRDLLRMETHEPNKQGPVIVANPQFSTGAEASEKENKNASGEESRIGFMGVFIPKFKPLAGTSEEAKTISGILAGAKVITGKDATESVMKEQRGPRILHVATHGFFLPDVIAFGPPAAIVGAVPRVAQSPKTETKSQSNVNSAVDAKYQSKVNSAANAQSHTNADSAVVGTTPRLARLSEKSKPGLNSQSTKEQRSVIVTARRSETDTLRKENSLLRSGIVLAGANSPASSNSKDDGILTALEVSGMDLWGTRLVVLSACETGLGDYKQGEGVYGLRRALFIAGAETEVISLWPVSDLATTYLMTDFYKRLLAGGGRMESLRLAQLKMLKMLPHPYYWAAFIPVGDWKALPPP
jgi:CHAT domain-containing protein/Flp pilus assembly protein TadD